MPTSFGKGDKLFFLSRSIKLVNYNLKTVLIIYDSNSLLTFKEKREFPKRLSSLSFFLKIEKRKKVNKNK